MRLILTPLLLIIVSSINAQNLPTIQQESVQAPAKIKIDGKTDEWGNKFQAFNKSTQIHYTISNDANNLYLSVQAIDFNTIKKILAGGITLTLNKFIKKKDSAVVSFTFPFYEKGQKLFSISNQWVSQNKTQVDSFANVYNRQLPTAFKLIGVNGLKVIDNGSISIYNEDKIKAAVLFDKDMHYNYELAVPLNLIPFTTNEMLRINYNIQLNGQKSIDGYAIESVPGRENILLYVDSNGQRTLVVGPGGSPDKDLYYPTDFWGEYKLIK